jgi:hypothetical protein
VAQHLDETHHGEVSHVAEEPSTLRLEAVAAEPEHVDGSRLLAEPANEIAGVEVARRLAAGDEQPPARERSGRNGQDGGSIRGECPRTARTCLREGTEGTERRRG